jgi:hypothetical protein
MRPIGDWADRVTGIRGEQQLEVENEDNITKLPVKEENKLTHITYYINWYEL